MCIRDRLSIAAFEEGRHAQAFPSFGSERTGAPVVAFCRIADQEIRMREPIMEPDALIIQDPTLLLPVSYTHLDVYKRQRFNLSFMRHTQQWAEVYRDLGLEKSLEAIRDDPFFEP